MLALILRSGIESLSSLYMVLSLVASFKSRSVHDRVEKRSQKRLRNVKEAIYP